ncbi:hypothetical protein [uncultured Dialister sp.]|jgi:hypothetical protein|nr:hypothetical protein [uncultured Dialister sp.]
MEKNEAEALDVCCGGRMVYYEKDNSFGDKREKRRWIVFLKNESMRRMP